MKIWNLSVGGLLVFTASALAQTPGEENVSDTTTTGLISGRVISDSGAPIPNAAVFLRGVNSTPTFVVRRTLTDREGAFRIEGLERALYIVTVSAPSYAQPLREPNALPNYYRVGDSITFTLIRGGVITGTVTTGSGEPAVGLNVRAVMVRDATGVAPRTVAAQFGERFTDDRGVYRIYGLRTGAYLVYAGGRGTYNFSPTAFDNDSPTYAPSATRDTAAEVEVTAATESHGVDIRYRGEPGRPISGSVTRLPTHLQFVNNSVTLRRLRGGVAEFASFTFANSGSQGFSFYGVPDGEYELDVQAPVSSTEAALSDPLRVSVKGADVSGIVLTPKLLSTVGGRVVLEASTSPQCQNKRRPAFEETVVNLQRSQEVDPKERRFSTAFAGTQASPDKAGEFLLRNIGSGRYNLSTRFFARYWFLRSIAVHLPGAPKGIQPIDLARAGLFVRSAERLTNLVITLAEGAGSVRGKIKVEEGNPA